MKKEERIQVVKDIANLLKNKYKNKFVAFGLLGSMAIGDETDFSDIEAVCILKGKNVDKDLHFVYKECYIHIWYGDINSIINGIKEINIDWSAEIGHFNIIRIIAGDKSIARKIKEEIFKIPQKELNKCIENNLPMLLEDRDKFKSIKLRGGMNLYETESIKFHLINKSNSLLGLLNKSPIAGSGYRSLKWVSKFKKKPRNYIGNINEVIIEKDLDILIEMVDVFVDDLINFMKTEGINFKEEANLDKVKF